MKNNLMGYHENLEGQTWIYKRKKKECQLRIRGMTTTRIIQEGKEGRDESNDTMKKYFFTTRVSCTRPPKTHVSPLFVFFLKYYFIPGTQILLQKKSSWNYELTL